MYPNTLLLATTLTTCWAYSDNLAQDDVLRTFPRMRRSLMTVDGATLYAYASPSLPCNGEGFYSHVSDCTNFYRCIDVFGNHDYLRIAFKCHAGTIFSPEYKTCIPGTCSPGQASATSVSAAAAAAAATAAAAGDEDVVSVANFRPQGTHTSSTSSTNGSLQCRSEGRFADSDDCGQYYDCVPSHDGGLVAHQQSCLGHAFHPALKACVPWQMVNGCVPSSARSFPVADPKVQQLCSNADNEFLCIDCKTLVMCIEGNPYTDSCYHGSVCSMKKSFGGGICYPGDPVECTCNKADILKQDFYNPAKFISCGKAGTDPIIHSCPEGLVFKEQRKDCGKEIESTCTASGTFVVKNDCTKYYTCIFTTEGWLYKEFTCRNNTMFNTETGKCEDPCDWYSGHFTCKEEGRFANPADCRKYYECLRPLNSTRLSWVKQECPEGFEWSQTMKRGVGHCVPSVTAEEKCLPPLNPNKCKIPIQWCTAEVNFKTVGGTAKASSSWSTSSHVPLRGFAQPGATWHSHQDSRLPQSIWYEFPQALRVVKYSFQSRTDSTDRSRGASSYEFWGSDSLDCSKIEAKVILLKDTSGTPFSKENTPKVEDVENPHSYRCYGFTITATPSNTYATMSNIRFFYTRDGVQIREEGSDTAKAAGSDTTKEDGVQFREEGSDTDKAAGSDTAKEDIHCPEGSFTVGAQCFFIPMEGFKTWDDAQAVCREQGGFLAEPDSIPDFHKAISDQSTHYGFWLGGSDIEQEGLWRWSSDGNEVGNTESWYPGEPNNSGKAENCLFLMKGEEQPLADRSCGLEHHYFVCEKK